MKSSVKLYAVIALTIMFTTSCNRDKDKSKDNENLIDTVKSEVINTDSAADTSILNLIDDSLIQEDTKDEAADTKVDPLKIGHINSNEILALLPDVKAADAQLQRYAKQLDDEIKRQYGEYQQKYTALMSDTTLPKSVMDAKAQELASLESNITQLQQSSQDQMLKKKDELYQPILAKIDRAIQSVAKEQHYTYIIDASTGALVYGVDTYDITPYVKKKLGI